MSDDVEREIVLPAASDEVWEAITAADEIGEWFGAEADDDVRPGGRVTFRWPDGTKREAVVQRVEPGERLVYKWLPYEVSPDGRLVERTPSTVAFELEPTADGTRLRVVESPAQPVRPVARFRALARA